MCKNHDTDHAACGGTGCGGACGGNCGSDCEGCEGSCGSSCGTQAGRTPVLIMGSPRQELPHNHALTGASISVKPFNVDGMTDSMVENIRVMVECDVPIDSIADRVQPCDRERFLERLPEEARVPFAERWDDVHYELSVEDLGDEQIAAIVEGLELGGDIAVIASLIIPPEREAFLAKLPDNATRERFSSWWQWAESLTKASQMR